MDKGKARLAMQMMNKGGFSDGVKQHVRARARQAYGSDPGGNVSRNTGHGEEHIQGDQLNPHRPGPSKYAPAQTGLFPVANVAGTPQRGNVQDNSASPPRPGASKYAPGIPPGNTSLADTNPDYDSATGPFKSELASWEANDRKRFWGASNPASDRQYY